MKTEKVTYEAPYCRKFLFEVQGIVCQTNTEPIVDEGDIPLDPEP